MEAYILRRKLYDSMILEFTFQSFCLEQEIWKPLLAYTCDYFKNDNILIYPVGIFVKNILLKGIIKDIETEKLET